MDKRIAVSAGIVAVAPPVALGIFEVMEWKMPMWVALTLLAITASVGVIALLIMMHGVWTWSEPFRHRYSLRKPVYRKDAPHPHQWLLDMAEHQRGNPTTHLIVTERIIMGNNLGDSRPRLRLYVRFANYGVNDLIVSNPEGYPYFGDEKSEYYIRNEGGYHTVPAGNTATSFNLDIYIPSEFLDDVRNEVESPLGEVRRISLGHLRVKVRASADRSPEVPWGIGDRKEIFRPNR